MSAIHEGPDRIEFAPQVGRPMRQGSFAALREADGERARRALREGDAEQAAAWLGYMLGGYTLMTGIGFEWPLLWARFVAEQRGDGEAFEMLEQARHALAGLLDTAGPLERETGEAVLEAVAPLGPEALEAIPPLCARVRAPMEAALGGAMAAVGSGDFPEALARFEEGFERARHLHDWLFRWGWAVGSAAARLFGEEFAREALQTTVAQTSFYEPVWALSMGLTPRENAAMLAEHLRCHFTGPGRQGAAEVVEEEDRFRIVMDPCGSGGAMRRGSPGGAPGFDRFQEAAPVTWGRAGEVPIYCAHCAVNELESVRRLGYPLWVTEFDPDPARPCGWTVYKSPELIPEESFHRLGATRDPARFVRLPVVQPGS